MNGSYIRCSILSHSLRVCRHNGVDLIQPGHHNWANESINSSASSKWWWCVCLCLCVISDEQISYHRLERKSTRNTQQLLWAWYDSLSCHRYRMCGVCVWCRWNMKHAQGRCELIIYCNHDISPINCHGALHIICHLSLHCVQNFWQAEVTSNGQRRRTLEHAAALAKPLTFTIQYPCASAFSFGSYQIQHKLHASLPCAMPNLHQHEERLQCKPYILHETLTQGFTAYRVLRLALSLWQWIWSTRHRIAIADCRSLHGIMRRRCRSWSYSHQITSWTLNK